MRTSALYESSIAALSALGISPHTYAPGRGEDAGGHRGARARRDPPGDRGIIAAVRRPESEPYALILVLVLAWGLLHSDCGKNSPPVVRPPAKGAEP
jgi:hypothetical protein